MKTNKEEKTIYKPKKIIKWLFVLTFFIIELFFYTWCRVQCTNTGYDIRKKIKDHERLLALQKNLKIELASLKSPERISRLSKQNFGLVTPDPSQIIILP